MLSAGEASGDLHAASLFTVLRRMVPDVRGIGMGGAAMREAGVDIRFDSSGIGVIGLAEIARHFGEIQKALRVMKELLHRERPDLVICVDYKEFNFRLAKAAKSLGIKVLFYVSPQVWAWREGRVKSYGQIIDHMAVIFPFELPFYDRYGIPATYVGHPLAGKVRSSEEKSRSLNRLGLRSGEGPVIGLLPGSRSNEIARLLPTIIASARRLQARYPSARFLLFRAPSLGEIDLAAKFEGVRGLILIEGQDYNALQCCDAVITVSGTATLEVALMGVPMVIVYRLSPLSYWIGRMLVRVPFIGLPNILMGRGIVREFIQDEASPENVSGEITRILEDSSYREAMRQDLGGVRSLLGPLEGSRELARLAASMLETLPVIEDDGRS